MKDVTGPTATTASTASGRPLRADAAKNRLRILDAAAEVFAAEGVSVPIDLVAARAKVGVGTLYRHFPTKEDLFGAIVAIKITDLVSWAQEASTAKEPGAALFGFLGLLATEVAVKQDLFDALDSAGIDLTSRFAPSVGELAEAIDVLLRRAIAAGAVRADIGAKDLIGLVIGTCHGARRMGRDGESTQRLIAIVCAGLRPSDPHN